MMKNLLNSKTAIKVMSVSGTLACFLETGIKVFDGHFLTAILWGVCTLCWLLVTFYNFMED